MRTKFNDLLIEFGYSQSQLKRISGVAQSNISTYCRSREALESSTLITRLRLSKAFNMSLGHFEKIMELKPAAMVANNKQLVEMEKFLAEVETSYGEKNS